MVAPNSPLSPPRRRSSSASSPKISLTNAPAPTALEYAFTTVVISLISYGGNACADGAVSCQSGRRSNHRVNSVIRVFQGSQLSLQQDVLAFFDRFVQICGYIAYIRTRPSSCIPSALPEPHPGSAAVCGTDAPAGRSSVSQTRCHFIFQSCLVLEQFADLETDLRVFVRIERRDTGLGGTEGLACPDALPHTYQTEHGTASGSVLGPKPEYVGIGTP